MRGPELGVQADDIETPEIDQEPKQEVLENKNVGPELQELRFSHLYLDVLNVSNVVCVSGCSSTSAHRWARKNQRRPVDLRNRRRFPSKKLD